MIEVKNLSVSFHRYDNWFSTKKISPIRSLDCILEKGEVMAVVGESGAGKSLLAHAILGLLPSNAQVEGEICFRGELLTQKRLRHLRGKEIAFIPQSVGFLNPLWTVGGQVSRAARLCGQDRKKAEASRDQAFRRYQLSDKAKKMFPFQVSGGMARRVLTASATVGDAELIIADEPTTGLDEERLRQSLQFLRHLADKGKGVLLITHDIEAALEIADKVAVFQNGVTVEIAIADDFKEPLSLRHPYTRELFGALPQKNFTSALNGKRVSLNGHAGCVFFGACPKGDNTCKIEEPPVTQVGNGWVRCHYAECR